MNGWVEESMGLKLSLFHASVYVVCQRIYHSSQYELAETRKTKRRREKIDTKKFILDQSEDPVSEQIFKKETKLKTTKQVFKLA